MTLSRLSSYDILLQRLAQDLQHMAPELRQFIQKEHAVVRRRRFAWHRHVVAADQPRIRDGMVGRATRAGRDQRRTVPVRPATRGKRVVAMASARDIAGRTVVSRLASIDLPAQGAQQEQIVVRTPASASALHPASLRTINKPQEGPITLT
jgi:hypothetical protein